MRLGKRKFSAGGPAESFRSRSIRFNLWHDYFSCSAVATDISSDMGTHPAFEQWYEKKQMARALEKDLGSRHGVFAIQT
jgi:hypothetical protein